MTSTSHENARTLRGWLAVAGGVAAAMLVWLTVVGSATAKARAGFEPRVLTMLELGSNGARTPRPPAGTISNASLVLERDAFQPLPDVPGALQTTHFRNNNRGQYVGAYVDVLDGITRLHGFLMDRKGEVTRLDVPGALVTIALGVNDRGQVVGSWVGPDATVDPVTGETGPSHGFLWEKGRYTKFDVPGSTATAGYEIDECGRIVGNYSDVQGAQHGYGVKGGKVTTIDHPGAAQAPNLTGTRVVGIDDRGRLVGGYGDEQGLIHAWAWKNGRFTDLEPPRGLQAEASEINNRGQIVGRYVDARPKLVSFLYEHGRYTRIEVPGRCDTAALGINDRGQIAIAAAGTTDGTTCPPPEDLAERKETR